MKKHANIPIFIPHEGCKNECVFCNQRTITGTCQGSDRDIIPEIEQALSTIPKDYDIEIAFFGGSFTGIGNERMTRLLDAAYEYIKSGKVQSIRLSTRPDYIDKEILDILKSRGVTHIELGIQSMRQKVLDASKRGHTVEDTERACRLINDYGFILGGQMMIGLPSSTAEDEIFTAKRIGEMGAKEARIYPCVVFNKTELCQMAKTGKYTPISVEEAVIRSTRVYYELKKHKINILRIGLQSSESLSDKNEVFAGAYHPAMGELVESRVKLEEMLSSIERYKAQRGFDFHGQTFTVECNRCDLSKVIGHKKSNMEIIRKAAIDAGFSDINIKINDKVKENSLMIHFGQQLEI